MEVLPTSPSANLGSEHDIMYLELAPPEKTRITPQTHLMGVLTWDIAGDMFLVPQLRMLKTMRY
jgi:hypothetical protein